MKKILIMVLCCIVLVFVLVACESNEAPAPTPPATGDNQAATPGEPPPPTEIDEDVHYTFTVWMYATANDLYSGYSNNPSVNYLNQRFNVTLDFIQPVAGTEADALALMFGTAQYTDLIDVTTFTGSIAELYQDGVIVDISNYLQYMPNLSAHLDANDNIRRQFFNDDGRILTLTVFGEVPEIAWGGLVYRHDILEAMTGGNVQFPSGNEGPVTVEDWEYMLPLFQQFFQVAGFHDYAPLIIPATGTFWDGALVSGFGFPGPVYFYDTRTGVVNHGYMTDGFLNYLQTMNRWFENGWIYRDFATRVGDMFFLPNPALTFGGAAGVWFGLQSQLGDAMSMPEHGLYFDVRPAPTPLDEAFGVTGEQVLDFIAPYYQNMATFVVTTATSNIPRLLTVLDFMYSDEGGLIWTYGLTAEQIPENDTVYTQAGLSEGAFWFENGSIVINPLIDLGGGTIQRSDVNLIRLPGFNRNAQEMSISAPIIQNAHNHWAKYDPVGVIERLPTRLSFSVADDIEMATRDVMITDFAEGAIQRFIMGTDPINEETFEAFRNQLIALGILENIRINQEALDRYLTR